MHFGDWHTASIPDLRQGIRNEPFYNIGGFSALRPALDFVALPEENPLHASSGRRSWAAASRVDFTPNGHLAMSSACRTATTRAIITTRTVIRARASVPCSMARNLGPPVELRLSYGYADSRLLEPLGWIPFQTHTADAGLELERAFSPTRRLLVSFGGGAIRAFTRERFTRESSTSGCRLGMEPCGRLGADLEHVGRLSAIGRRAARHQWDAFTTDAGLVRVGGFVSTAPRISTLDRLRRKGKPSRHASARTIPIRRRPSCACCCRQSGPRWSATTTISTTSATSIPSFASSRRMFNAMRCGSVWR